MEILITGGSGFIGSNLVAYGIKSGHKITVLDNLSRPGTSSNLEWLRSLGNFEFVQCDICNFSDVQKLFYSKKFDAVFHQAAQVAVTKSVQDPRNDFEINALGTFNLLEAIRLSNQKPVFVFASTNKVYGALAGNVVIEKNNRYTFQKLSQGIPEDMLLDFYSPYGCSKGAADQYVNDYRRIYGLRTITFRQSCIYGPRQMGLEDQGWVAWFVICAVLGRPITVYGDGKQVRDLLYIDDLVDLYFKTIEMEPNLKTFTFNVGGGPDKSLSILEVIKLLEEEIGQPIQIKFSNWRPGDQKVYVSDIRAVCREFKWMPKVSPKQGISNMLKWVRENQVLFCNFV